LSNVVAVGGSWVCPTSDIRAQAWDEITSKAQRAVISVKD
jgi:2-dehydro-3-deoxyphosphogluconate aldolase/(4S)-4-hydroxy-2-oxoglutarate aldolase